MEIAENLPITEGVERLMFVLKRYGYKIAILSGGFTYFGNYLKDKFLEINVVEDALKHAEDSVLPNSNRYL